ncbi:hypothetical protein [Actinomadura monticuli]|uniref:CBS domain-containing protein n=1 Tax=Actinomadura monticuli TaxID=3097367 RepID=A0ABV4QHJ2_9ACTN
MAMRSRQSIFPVLDMTGDPVGAVTMDRLARLPSRDAGIAIGALGVPLDPARTVAPESPVTALLSKAPVADGLIAVVVASGHGLVGIVTTEDVRRLLQCSGVRLGRPATA